MNTDKLDAYIAKRERYVREATKHAAIALLWQATDVSEDGGAGFPVDDTIGPGHDDSGRDWWHRVAPLIESNVRSFIEANYHTLGIASISAEMAGHDLILTANGHGVGFWDRGYDMPAGDPIALGVWRAAHDRNWPAFYDAWLARARPYPMDRPKSVGTVLTDACEGYSFEAEFALDDDGDLGWLTVENEVLLDEMEMSG